MSTSGDKLQVQIALRIKAPAGTRITKAVLDEIVDRMVAKKKLPKNVEIRGVFWRNPGRKGNLAAWRYHRGADLAAAPRGPRESSPRGTLQSAIDSLATFIETGGITF